MRAKRAARAGQGVLHSLWIAFFLPGALGREEKRQKGRRKGGAWQGGTGIPGVPPLQDSGGWSRYALLLQWALRTVLGLGGETRVPQRTSLSSPSLSGGKRVPVHARECEPCLHLAPEQPQLPLTEPLPRIHSTITDSERVLVSQHRARAPGGKAAQCAEGPLELAPGAKSLG